MRYVPFLGSLGLCLLGCGPEAVPPGKSARPIGSVSATSTIAAILGTTELPSIEVARAGARSLGPYYARAGHSTLVVHAEGSDNGRKLVGTMVRRGRSAETGTLAESVGRTEALAVRAGGPGFLVAYTGLMDRGGMVSVIAVGADGVSRATPTELARTVTHYPWVDVIPFEQGALVLWVEELPSGDGNLLVARLDADGKPVGLPVNVARNLGGWAVVKEPNGVAIALVTGRDRTRNEGSLSWLRLSADGRPRNVPQIVAKRVSIDLDAALLGDRLVAGWTDRNGPDPELWLSAVDSQGKAAEPKKAFETVGGARLIRLLGGSTEGLLAWDSPLGTGQTYREVYLGRLSRDLEVLAGPRLVVDAPDAPELVHYGTGYASMFLGRVCEPLGDCQRPSMGPVFVSFDSALAVRATQPIVLGDGRDVATRAWGLSCPPDGCELLASQNSGSPAVVHLAEIPSTPKSYKAPVLPPIPSDAPKLASLHTVANGDTFADLAAVELGDHTVLASVTAFVEEHDPKKRARVKGGATVAYRWLDRSTPLTEERKLSTRALTAGGIAVAPGEKLEHGVAVAWAERRGADAIVMVAQIDKKGKRIREVSLASAKGEVAEVNLVWASGGWLVSWIDFRDGNGEVYAAKLDSKLGRVSREERITQAPGDATDLCMIPTLDGAIIAWSDPRDAAKEGQGDIFVAVLDGKKAKRIGDETRVLATAAHSRSPSLARTPDGAMLAWIEDTAGTGEAKVGPTGVYSLRISAAGKASHEPRRLELAGEGFAGTVSLSSSGRTVRALVTRSHKDTLSLDAIDGLGSTQPKAFELVKIEGPASMDVALAQVGSTVFVNEADGDPTMRRIRRAGISWTRTVAP